MSHASNSNEWRTPTKDFNRWNSLYKFTVDACAAKWNAQLPVYWTKALDMFKQDATYARAFMNPPYSAGNMPKFMAHARDQVLNHLADVWGCHIPAHTAEGWFTENVMRAPPGLRLISTDALELPGFANGFRRIWEDRFAVDVWFYEGRKTHTQRNGKGDSARFPNAFVVYGKPRFMPELRA